MSNQNIIATIEEIKSLEELEAELKAEIDSLKDKLKAVLLEHNTEELEIGTHIIRHTTVLSQRFDTTVFKREHAEMYKLYTKQSVSKRFSIA